MSKKKKEEEEKSKDNKVKEKTTSKSAHKINNENINNDRDVSKRKKELFLKQVKFEKRIISVLLVLTYIIIIALEVVVFNKGLNNNDVVNVISLGAMFSTFGSALAAISLALENDKYDRILRNVDIFFRDLAKEEPWRRWQFLKRSSKSKNLDSTLLTTTLMNPDINFDVGSHSIEVAIPTVREDFYDLPAFRIFFRMHFNKKHFNTNIANKKIILDTPDGYMGWSCLYDIWKSVMIYRFSRFLLKIGVTIIFTSIFLTIYFSL